MHGRRGILMLAWAMAVWAAGGCDDGSPSPVGRPVAAAPDTSGRPDEGPTEAPEPFDPALLPARDLIVQQRTPEAREALERLLATQPGNGQAEFMLGLTYHREKRYGLARPHFERAAELAPAYPATWHFLGWCCYYLGDLSCARRGFQRHLELQPREGDSMFGLGLVELEDRSLDEAERSFRSAIQVQADNPDRLREVAKAHARLGEVYQLRDQLPQARTELETAVQMWPQHYTAFFMLSRVLTRLGEQAKAEEAFRLYRHYQALAEPPRGVPEPPP